MKVPKSSCLTCPAREASHLSLCCHEEVEYMDEMKSNNRFKKGQIIYFEGNMPLGVFCVNGGSVKIYKTGMNGKEQILWIARQGDIIGYRDVICEEPYNATAEALEDTEACLLPPHAFMQLVNGNTKLARELTRSLCHDLGIAQERMMDMAQKNVRERMAQTLLLLLDTFKPTPQSEDTIALKLPREDIANMAGTSTETAIRILSEFNTDGLVELQGKNIRIANRKALGRIAEGLPS